MASQEQRSNLFRPGSLSGRRQEASSSPNGSSAASEKGLCIRRDLPQQGQLLPRHNGQVVCTTHHRASRCQHMVGNAEIPTELTHGTCMLSETGETAFNAGLRLETHPGRLWSNK